MLLTAFSKLHQPLSKKYTPFLCGKPLERFRGLPRHRKTGCACYSPNGAVKESVMGNGRHVYLVIQDVILPSGKELLSQCVEAEGTPNAFSLGESASSITPLQRILGRGWAGLPVGEKSLKSRFQLLLFLQHKASPTHPGT